MTRLEDVRDRLVGILQPLDAESVSLAGAGGRFLAHDFHAALHLPPFDNSAMDGYALRAEDTAHATLQSPVLLEVVGQVAAGRPAATAALAGTCLRVFTGAPLPPGTDSVVMQEDVVVPPDNPSCIQLHEPVKPWEFVRFRGEDVKPGDRIGTEGARIGAGLLSLLASCGMKSVSVRRQPRVSILVTGTELQSPGQDLGPGQVYESNSVGLAELIRCAGGLPRVMGIVGDDPEDTRSALREAFLDSDLVITAGGASVGDHDLVRPALVAMGGSVDTWQIAIKPGKPFFHGQFEGTTLLGLPGNPVSALVTALLLAVPAVRRLQGAARSVPPSWPVNLGEPFENPGNRRHFIRVRFDADGRVRRAGIQASHILSSMGLAEGVIDVPPGASLAAGSTSVFVPFFRSD